MTLKQGSKVKFDTCKRLADHDSKKSFSHSSKGDKAAILFSKQGQNYSQASVPSHLHFGQM